MLETLPQAEGLTPRCVHFGLCGGCRFQQIGYDDQLLYKEALIKEKFSALTEHFHPIIPCDSPWEYRNKMEFSFSQSLAGERFLGLMMRGKRGKVVTLTECHLTSPWFTDVLERVHEWWKESGINAYHPPSDRGSLRTLTLREGKRTGERMGVLTLSGNPDYALDQETISHFIEAIGPLDALILRTQHIAKKTPTRFEEAILSGKGYIREQLFNCAGEPLLFKIRPSSFFQPNTAQAERLYTRAIELAEISPEETVLDLYCGTGAIGLFAAPYAKEVIGIELNEEAVADAKDNISQNQLKNMHILVGDVADALPKELLPTTLIVDPPRAGLSPKALEEILKLTPQKILYISCNPTTQARDVKKLIEEGFEIVAVQPVDQFPHTPHIENIIALRRPVCYTECLLK